MKLGSVKSKQILLSQEMSKSFIKKAASLVYKAMWKYWLVSKLYWIREHWTFYVEGSM